MTIDFQPLHARLLVGSQHLYGPDTLKQVDANARAVAEGLNADAGLPIRINVQPVLTTPDAVTRALADADRDDHCVGVICWMHTFSPAKMWVHGLSRFHKPLCHLHTQFHRDIPWSTLDMDYMNLHQSAHGGREFGHVCTRLDIKRAVVVGHWQDPAVYRRIESWQRAAAAIHDGRRLKVARLGDNMRQVAVTEGDKVEAQLKLGYEVHGYGLGDLAEHLNLSKTPPSKRCARPTTSYIASPRRCGPTAGGGRSCETPPASSLRCVLSWRLAGSTPSPTPSRTSPG